MRQPVCGGTVVCVGTLETGQKEYGKKEKRTETLVGKKGGATFRHSKSPHRYGVGSGPLLPSS